MLYGFFRFGKYAIDAEMLFELTAIFLVMLLIFKFVKKKEVLFIVLAALFAGIILCEILYYRKSISMTAAFFVWGAEYLLVPGALAIITWLIVRRVREKKQRTAER